MIAPLLGRLNGTGRAMALSLGLGQAATLLIPLALDGGALAIPSSSCSSWSVMPSLLPM